MLVDEGDSDGTSEEMAWRFRLEQGHGCTSLYPFLFKKKSKLDIPRFSNFILKKTAPDVLSGDARNKCLHGVKADGELRQA